MTTTRNQPPPLTKAIEAWENEGGAPCHGYPQRQFGRRVEADRQWTVYHVFSGVPASVDSRTLTGMSRSEATNSMMSLNARCASMSAPATGCVA